MTVPTARQGVASERIHRFRAMATQVTVRFAGDGSPERDHAHAGQIQAVFAEVEQQCTRFDPTSPLMQANAAGDAWCAVPARCLEAIAEARDAHDSTDGLFDPRVLETLVGLGYDRSLPFDAGSVVTSRVGCPAQTADGRWRPGIDRQRGAVRVGPRPVDLGGIGKGLAVRWAAAAVADRCPNLMIEAGGDCLFRGAGPEGTGWRVAVEDPDGAERPVAVLEVSDRAVATSSIRVRRWSASGADVHHLIDPRTQRPGTGGLTAVTVVGDDPARAEVWSKVLFLGGAEAIARQCEDGRLAALWIDTTGRCGTSSAMREFAVWQR